MNGPPINNSTCSSTFHTRDDLYHVCMCFYGVFFLFCLFLYMYSHFVISSLGYEFLYFYACWASKCWSPHTHFTHIFIYTKRIHTHPWTKCVYILWFFFILLYFFSPLFDVTYHCLARKRREKSHNIIVAHCSHRSDHNSPIHEWRANSEKKKLLFSFLAENILCNIGCIASIANSWRHRGSQRTGI